MGGRLSPELPGEQLGHQSRQQHQQGSRAILGRSVAAIGRTGLAELGLDVRRCLGVDAAVRRGAHIFPGARTGNHHAVVNRLLHLFAHGARLGQLLVERV